MMSIPENIVEIGKAAEAELDDAMASIIPKITLFWFVS